MLTDEQILSAIKSCPPVKHDYAGWVRDLRLLWGRAIEAAACAERDKRIAELERQLEEARNQALEDAALECDGVYHKHIGPGYAEVRYGIAACSSAIRAMQKDQS